MKRPKKAFYENAPEHGTLEFDGNDISYEIGLILKLNQ
jgi:hypothetical protein